MLFNWDLKKQGKGEKITRWTRLFGLNVFTGMIFTEQYFSDELLNLTDDCFKLRLTNTVIRTSIITSELGEIISPVLYVTIMIVTITQMFGSTSGFCSDDFRFP